MAREQTVKRIKTLHPEKRRVQVSVRVSPATHAYLASLGCRNMGRAIDTIVNVVAQSREKIRINGPVAVIEETLLTHYQAAGSAQE